MPKESKTSTWQKVQEARSKHPRCSCRLRPNMTWIQLRALGIGCGGSGVCPVLRTYREGVGVPSPEDYAEGRVAGA